MKHILIAFGTRPEVIKLAPVIRELKEHCKVTLLHTGQHKDLVLPMFDLFEIAPDIDLEIMQPGQDLFDLTQNLLPKLRDVLQKTSPDFVMVQGDTSTSYLNSLAAYYQKIPVLHIEAGLRSHDPYYPFPEEMNRKQITHLATHHFAPTPLNRTNLLDEGIDASHITVTGNTVIDALQLIKKTTTFGDSKPSLLSEINDSDKLVVLTAHRRENHGKPLQNIFKAVFELLENDSKIKVIFPAHPNPQIQKAINVVGLNSDRFLETSPFDYLSFLHILDRADLILTDSGGIQEEASVLGKPVLVLRNETERQELIESGLGELVGADQEKIVQRTHWFLQNKQATASQATNLFGDGNAAKKIRKVIIGQL